MYKRKTLTALLIVSVLAFATVLFGVKGITAVHAEEAPVKATVLLSEDKTVVTGYEVPEGVTEFEAVIPDGVKEIGDYAFNDSGLTAVTLNDGLETIGSFAFSGTVVTSVDIPATVTKIGDHAFEGCSSLSKVEFAQPESLEISGFAFNGCGALSVITLPDNTQVRQFAFDKCMNLQWVYTGNNSRFTSTSGDVLDARFFPTTTSLTIVFPSKSEYNGALNQTDKTFKNQHESAAHYIVKVNCYIGGSETPVVYERLNGRSFDYVPDKTTGLWNADTAFGTLPAQDATYSSTAWYGDNEFKNAVSYDKVNELLATESEINLYCHATIAVPSFPAEPVSWVYDKNVSYDITDISDVLKALGCEKEFTEAQLAALDFKVSFADEKGNVAETPEAINGNGTYNVTLSLKPEFGSWSQEVTSSVTVNVNTNGFTTVMIVLLVVGVLAVVITASTAIIRKKVQQRNRKKQLTQKEILEKFKATGEETTLE